MHSSSTPRVIALTGSTRGIGLACAQAFARAGATVIVNGRTEQGIAEAKAAFPETAQVYGVCADVTTEAGAQAFADGCRAVAPRLDALISCVGNGAWATGYPVPWSEWEGAFAQNFWCHVRTVDACLPLLRAGSPSSICLIGSIAGLQHLGAPVPYAVAKSALHTYAKELSFSLATDGIRVNVIHPGNILVPGGRWEQKRAADPDRIHAMLQASVPQQRFGTPEEVASLVEYVSRPEAAFVTGSAFVVDGGQTTSFS